MAKIAACHPNLRFKTVTEWHRCAIDDDSKMRFGATQTNPRHRQQLQTRVSRTSTLRKGCLAPDTESSLIHTEGTRTSKPCGVLSGIEIDRFEPLIPCIESVVQDPQHT
jgi:hypothetical protein